MTQSLAFKMVIRPFGDSALLVDIDAGSSDASSDIVMALDSQILRQRTRGITQTTPSYNSLLVCFEPDQVQHSALQNEIHAIANTINVKDIPEGNQWSLPACFDEPYALDRTALETELSRDWQFIVNCFCATEYRVHAVGFLPGFTYLGNLPDALHCNRLRDPRATVPASSIAIAGTQAGIYPFDSPGGWRIIGRLPFTVFQTQADPPALFQANDRIRFEAVTPEVFEALEQRPIASLTKQATRR
ncbi:MAG: allophanate hydrolase subunit 1 [Pseudomonadota bacterium]|nr:allophanate hydrolase subunit 1 [Pseudomonadota bacterium]